MKGFFSNFFQFDNDYLLKINIVYQLRPDALVLGIDNELFFSLNSSKIIWAILKPNHPSFGSNFINRIMKIWSPWDACPNFWCSFNSNTSRRQLALSLMIYIYISMHFKNNQPNRPCVLFLNNDFLNNKLLKAKRTIILEHVNTFVRCTWCKIPIRIEVAIRTLLLLQVT